MTKFELAKRVASSLRKHPDDWGPERSNSIDDLMYCIVHITGARIWVINGFWFYHLRNKELGAKEYHFGLLGKPLVYWSARHVVKRCRAQVERRRPNVIPDNVFPEPVSEESRERE